MIDIHNLAAPISTDRFKMRALLVGIVGVVICVILAVFNYENFLRSYLVAFLFWIGIALGSLALLMVQHLSGGAWGVVSRRIMESATRTLPLLLIFFIPVVIGMRSLYIWTNQSVLDKSHHVAAKAEWYLNAPGFVIRAAIYFAIWIGMAYLLNKWSLQQDRSSDRSLARKLQTLSGPGIVIYGLTITFASVDWAMSLEPEWYSTIYGVLFMGGQALSSMAFIIATLLLLSRRKPMSDVLLPTHFHDLGKLMFAFVMLWAYFSFSQLLITWSGNLPEETPWYIRRIHGGWQYIGIVIALFHFALPFLILLSRDIKRNSRLVGTIAIWIIVMRFVDLFYLVAPAFAAAGSHGGEHGGVPKGHIDPMIALMAIVAVIGLGGLWLAYFAHQLKQRPLLPIGDPNLGKALAHGGGH